MTKLSYFTDSIFRATARFCLCLFYGYFLISVLTSINYNPIQEGKENINKSRGRLRPDWLAVSLPAPDQIQAVDCWGNEYYFGLIPTYLMLPQHFITFKLRH